MPHSMLLRLAFSLTLLLTTVPLRAGGAWIDTSRPQRFLDTGVHLMLGGSYMTNDYPQAYPQISDISTSMGLAGGIGATARMYVRRYLAIGCECNLVRSRFKTDMAVIATDRQGVSNVYERDYSLRLDLPVYVSVLMDVSNAVRWNVDLGMYYAYGLKGSQRASIYDVRVNDLGQLMMTVTPLKTGFYRDAQAFINSYRRGDLGLHLATGLEFGRHFTVGARFHYGLSNAAVSTGIIPPSCHTIDLLASIGWRF